MHSIFLPGLILFVNCFLKASAFRDFYWRDYIPGDLPDDAFTAAPNTYIGQVTVVGNNLVATIYPNENLVVTNVFGSTKITENIRILCTGSPGSLYWESINFWSPSSETMLNAIKGGNFIFSSSAIYIGKVRDANEWKIGSVVGVKTPFEGLWLWNSHGGSSRYLEFEILKCNSANFNNSVKYVSPLDLHTDPPIVEIVNTTTTMRESTTARHWWQWLTLTLKP